MTSREQVSLRRTLPHGKKHVTLVRVLHRTLICYAVNYVFGHLFWFINAWHYMPQIPGCFILLPRSTYTSGEKFVHRTVQWLIPEGGDRITSDVTCAVPRIWKQQCLRTAGNTTTLLCGHQNLNGCIHKIQQLFPTVFT